MIRFRHAAFLTVVFCLSTAGFAWAVTGMPGFSTYLASLMKATISFVVFAGFLYWALEIDTEAEMENIRDNPIAMAILIHAIATLLSPSVASGQISDRPVIDTAKAHIGVTEAPLGSNAGPSVEHFLSHVGLGPGYPWCAAYARTVMDEAGVKRPKVVSAGATDYITRRSIDATDVLRGAAEVPPGSLVIWRRGSTWKGHIGVVLRWGQRCGRTIEGNTSPGHDGAQRDGDGVWLRERCIRPGSYFRIIAFTPTS
jgi:hypothetical protein